MAVRARITRAALSTTALVAGLVLGLPDPVAAQQLEEIIVTAQKREQSIQKVPVSVTAFTQEELTRSQVEEFADYALRTPNVGFTSRGDQSDTRFTIRGVGPISSGGSANSVGLYVDEFNIAPNVATRTADPDLVDIERIEVLRGPQGTFFGRNTIGGAISITSAKPDPKGAFGQVTGEIGSWDTYKLRALANVPLSDRIAARALVHYSESDGFLDNVGPHGRGNMSEDIGGRLALRFLALDRTTVDLTIMHSKQERNLPPFVPTGFASVSVDLLRNFGARVPFSTPGYFPDNSDTVSTDIGAPSDNETTTLVGRIDHDLDWATLTVVGGWIDNSFRSDGEGDFTEAPAFTVRRDTDMEAYSVEARLAGASDRLNWLAGVMVAHDSLDIYDGSTHLATDPFLPVYNQAFAFLGGGLCGLVRGAPCSPLPGFARFRFMQDTSAGFFENVTYGGENDSYAVFADATYSLTERFDISLGARYSRDEVSFYRLEGPLMVGLAPRVSNPGAETSFEDFSPRAAATFALADGVTTYATVSRGYRQGGFNTLPTDPDFDSESAWNYEVGLKSDLFDDRARLNLAAFYMDWKDLQVRSQDVVTQRQFVQNASSATNKGVEVELYARPLDGVDLSLAYGYLDATFDDFRNAQTLDGTVIDASGNRIPQAPRNTFSAVGQYTLPMGSGMEAFVRAEYTFIDDIQEDVADNARRLNPSYELVNLRIGVEGERYSVTAFAENLFDERYRKGTSNLETYFSGAQANVGEPRRYGVVLTLRF